MISDAQREQFFEHGYLIVRNVVSQDRVERCRVGIETMLERAQEAKLQMTKREQEIIFGEKAGNITNLLSPKMYQTEITEVLENTNISYIAESIFEKPVRFSLHGLFLGLENESYIQDWHKDILNVLDPYPITKSLRFANRYCQINAPLYEDRFFVFVPGSHLRRLTVEETELLKQDPKADLPGVTVAELSPGDVVFYNADLIHRGYNPKGIFRRTLNYVFWTADSPYFPQGEEKQLEWLNDQTSLDLYGPRTRTLLERFLEVIK